MARPSFMTKEQLDKYLTDLRQSRTGTVKPRVASNLDQGVSKRWSLSEVPRAEVGVNDVTNENERRDSIENYTTNRSSTAPATGSLRIGRTDRGPRNGWRANNGWIRPTRSNTIDSAPERGGLSASGPQSNSNGNIQATQNAPSKAQAVVSDRNLNPTVEIQEDEDDPGYLPTEEPLAPAPLNISKAKPAETNYRLHSSQRPEPTPEVTNNSKIEYSSNTAPNPGSGPPELEQRPKWNDMAIPTHAPARPQTPPTKVMMVEDGKVVGEMVMPQEVDESKLTLARGNPWSKGVKPSADVARLPMAMEKKISGGSPHPQIQSMTFEEFAAMDLKVGPPAEPVDLTGEEVKPSRTPSVALAEKRLEQLQMGRDRQPEVPRGHFQTFPAQQYGRPAHQLSGPRANPRQPSPPQHQAIPSVSVTEQPPAPPQRQRQPSPPQPQAIPSISVPEEPPAPPQRQRQPSPPQPRPIPSISVPEEPPAPPQRQRHWQQPPQRQRVQEEQQPQRQEQPIPSISVPDETPRDSQAAQRPLPTFSFSEDPAPRQPPPHHHLHHHNQPANKPPVPTFSFSEDPSPVNRSAPPQPPIPTISFPDDTLSQRALPQQPSVPTISFPDAPSQRGHQQPPVPTINFPDDAPSQRALPQQPPVPTISFPDNPPSNSNPSSRPLPSTDRGNRGSSRPLPQAAPQGSSRPLPPPKGYDAYNTHYRQASDRIPRSKAICTACRNPITARAVNAMNLHFHPECFSCSHCRIKLEHVAFYPEPLPEGAPPNTPRSGRFFCHCDFHELFSPRCKSCKTPIEGEVVVALGASWHVGHFFCAECGDPFDSSTKFVEKENYAWCLGCYQRRYSTKCKRCRKPVTDTVVKALDAEWHVDCFCCTECGSQFDDGRYFLRGGSSQDPVCVRCEEARLKS